MIEFKVNRYETHDYSDLAISEGFINDCFHIFVGHLSERRIRQHSRKDFQLSTTTHTETTSNLCFQAQDIVIARHCLVICGARVLEWKMIEPFRFMDGEKFSSSTSYFSLETKKCPLHKTC